jgi:ribosomal protein S19
MCKLINSNIFKSYKNIDYKFLYNFNKLSKKDTKLQKKNTKSKEFVYTSISKKFFILKEYLNKEIFVSNGLELKKLLIDTNMLAFKLGAFCLTKRKTYQIHKKKLSKKKSKQK